MNQWQRVIHDFACNVRDTARTYGLETLRLQAVAILEQEPGERLPTQGWHDECSTLRDEVADYARELDGARDLLAAATATLERVRAVLSACPSVDPDGEGPDWATVQAWGECIQQLASALALDPMAEAFKLRAALADQPEAGEAHDCDSPDCGACTGEWAARVMPYEVADGQPEAPKGQEALTEDEQNHLGWSWPKALRIIAAANAKIAELEQNWSQEEASHRDSLRRWQETISGRDAAKARIAELATQLETLRTQLDHARADKEHANERADGAEGRYRQVVEINQANERAYLAKTDQLAASVTELTAQLEAGFSNAQVVEALERVDTCTTEERKVLEGAGFIAQWVLEDWASFAHAAMVFARAELANRAAKAKRGDK